jgi:tRNA/tmRNA/rRNA uracil-C5-methylase (TrmA/RlmC/RlmD family)
MEMLVRKRGGQPGNLNGVKHGFYSKRLKAISIDEATLLQENLNEEIALLRTMVRRFVMLYELVETLEERAKVIEVTSIAAVRIGSLLRTNYVLRGRTSDENPTAAIERALLDLAIQDGL